MAPKQSLLTLYSMKRKRKPEMQICRLGSLWPRSNVQQPRTRQEEEGSRRKNDTAAPSRDRPKQCHSTEEEQEKRLAAKPLQRGTRKGSNPRLDGQEHAAVKMWQNRTNLAEHNRAKVAKNNESKTKGAPCKVRLFVDLSKVNSQLVLHPRGGDLQHPCSRVQLPLDRRHPWHPLLARTHTLTAH